MRDVIRKANVLCPVSADLGRAIAEAAPSSRLLCTLCPTSWIQICSRLLGGVAVWCGWRHATENGS